GFYKAFEALSLQRMAEVWSETLPISCVHPGWALVAGRSSVLASWAGIFRGTERIRFELREPQAFVAGDTAWVGLVEAIEAQPSGGLVRALAHTTNVFVLEVGVWRLVHHHAAPTADAPRPPEEPERVLH